MYKCIIFCWLSLFFVGCSERDNAKDKYPDIPLFPASSNKHYVFEKKPFQGSVRLGDFMVSAEGASGGFVNLFDLTLGQSKSVPVEGNVELFDEFRQSIITQKNDSTFLRYKAPVFLKEKIPFRSLSNLYDSVKMKNPVTDGAVILSIVDSLTQACLKRYTCLTELWNRQYYVLHNEYQDLVIDARGVNINLKECMSELSQGPNNTLASFDEVSLGYSWVGSNHIAFGIEVHELRYYRIIIDKDTVKFKDPGKYFQLYRTQEQMTLIVDGNNNIFQLKPR